MKVLQYELSKISKPLNTTEITERIDSYQKLAKVIQFNLAFEIQKSSPQLSQGVRCMQMTTTQIGKIKEDVTHAKIAVAHLKHKIAENTKDALLLLEKKNLLESTKKIISEELCQYKEDLAEVKRLISEGQFVQAIQLCEDAITRTNQNEDSITGRLAIVSQLRERFEMIKNQRLVSHLQHTMSSIFKKQSS